MSDKTATTISSILPLAIFLLCAFAPYAASANPSDYDPATGEPECSRCHTPERRYSIDYTRDETCAQCHGPALSEDYISIDGRYRVAKDTGAQAREAGKEAAKTPGKRARKLTPLEMGSMTLVPAGEFTMGSNDWWPKSQPEHKRTIGAFYIDRYEVTNLRYKAFVDATGHPAPDHWAGGVIPPGREEHPVVYVNWHDAEAFCKWEGRRLPTEAEWEKAARSTDKRTFPWGNVFSKYKGNTPQLGRKDTMPVGSFEDGKSPYGAYDMAGNAFEWVDDWFMPYPGNKHADENYGEKFKVVRGGSWYDCTYYKCGISSPTFNRIFFNTPTKNNNFGIRCARGK